MLQLYPVYSLWSRRKTLTGSPDPTRANGTNKPCSFPFITFSFQVNERQRYYIIDAEITNNEWVQVVMVYKGSGEALRVHVNGDVRRGNVQYRLPVVLSSGEVVIGRKYIEEDQTYCSTMVDELMLWNRSLTEEEVENVMSENWYRMWRFLSHAQDKIYFILAQKLNVQLGKEF